MRFIITIAVLFICNSLFSQEAKMYPCRTECNIGVQLSDHKTGDSISVDGLLIAEGIKAEAGKFTIFSYKIAIDGEGFDDIWEIDNIGEKFTENAIKSFRKIRQAAFITFSCITAKDSNGFIVGLKPAFYLVK